MLARKLVEAVPADACVVLRYHSVNDDPGWSGDYLQDSLTVAPRTFDAQMDFLKRQYDVVGLGEIVERVRSGRPLNGRLAALTFDDGYEDNYRNALPILTKHGLTATFYVTTSALGDVSVLWTVKLRHSIRRTRRDSLTLPFAGERAIDISSADAKERAIRLVTSVVKRSTVQEADDAIRVVEEQCEVGSAHMDRRVMMTEEEVREMHSGGMEIGAHSVGHYNLPSIDETSLRREVVESRAFLENTLGAPVRHMAYPDGRTGRHFDARVAVAAAEAGYLSAATSVNGPVTSRYSVYSLPRLGVVPRHDRVSRLAADMQYTRISRPADGVFEEVRLAIGAGAASPGHGAPPSRVLRAGAE